MHVYKIIQSCATGEVMKYLIRRKPLLPMDAALMHYRVISSWYVETMGA